MRRAWLRTRRRARLPRPSLDTPWREAEFCVLDIETTGLDLRRDEIVSYGAAIVDRARIICGRAEYGLVQPDRPVSVASVTVHALHDADLAHAPKLDDVIDDLIALLAHRVLVAHAAWFEAAFLNRALARRGLRLHSAVIDTAALLRACEVSPAATERESSVEASGRRLGLPVHTPHHALGDAFTTAEIFLALATRLERAAATGRPTPLSVRRLCDLSRGGTGPARPRGH